jgi:membrane associated rhomboid family serine protease
MTVTLVLIAIIVVASLYAWSKPEVYHNWMMNPYQVHTNRQYYRFLTSAFIHKDYTHLFFNMFTLFFFGRNIEFIYDYFTGTGFIWYLALFLIGVVISDVPTYLKNRDNPGYNSLGASGGVAAIVFSSIMFDPTNKICLFGILCLPGFILGALYLIYSYQRGKQQTDGINHDAHLYGALFGIGFSFLVEPRVIFSFVEQLMDYRLF